MPEFDLKLFLAETKYCDISSITVHKIASQYRKKNQDDTELAKKFFYFVRDHIHYRVGKWTRTASATLKEREGTCTNSANLFVALCRAAGIPAGYGVMEVVGQSYFGPIALPELTQSVSKNSKHVYAFVYLNNQWVKCDPSDDEMLSIHTEHLNQQSSQVDWNGFDSAILQLDSDHVISDVGPLASIDHIIAKRQKKRLLLPVKIANTYIHFLRHNGAGSHSVEHTQEQFELWLRKESLFEYLLFLYLKVRYHLLKIF